MIFSVIFASVYLFGVWVGRHIQHQHTKDVLVLCDDYKAALEAQQQATALALIRLACISGTEPS